MIGETISHYRVLERLGGGGMGVVYKVWDLSLERFAALKVLNPERDASDDYKRRFIREARTASILDHPNICTIYESGESAAGQLFIAMAFCAGESLKSRLRRGPLALEHALEIAAQVAAGLDRAHEKGVVHRDIKPANVMLTEGRAVIVDFGIARLGDQSRLTRAGNVMGTTAYIAPERLLGDAADARADIWSLSVVLYEMVTGSLPFRGPDNPAVMSAILRRDAAPMSTLRPGIPAELDRIVARALAKRPADRYQRAGELCADLRAAVAAGILPAEPTEETLVESPSSAGRERPLSGVGVPGRSRGASGSRSRGSGGGEPSDAGDVRGLGGPGGPLGNSGLIGTTVSHYRVLHVLGGGGMGIVYQAEDTQLGRPVALKFLPPELTRDPDAKARFLQEARAASALDHPNICTIHEVGETADGQLFLAMACYDGETLKKRLERGTLPIDVVIDFAAQISRGLAKAHRQGIVHRDVKPANLMITGDDIVKILDFGIAKLAGAAAITRAGSSLGTPGYMSPEQAHGDEVDARTDLWSLGAVAYEMTTGRRPFRGDHEQAVLYALFHEQPEALTRLRPEAPPELERIVGRLLAKAPQERYQAAAEVVADLKALSGSPTGTQTLPATGPAALPATSGALQSTPGALRSDSGAFRSAFGQAQRSSPGSRGRRAAAVAAIPVIAVVLATAAGYLAMRSGAGKAASTAATGAPLRATFTQLTDFPGSESFPSLSPDGNFFLYSKSAGAKSHIFLQRVGGGNPIDLTRDPAQSDTQPAFSPDGQQIAFRSERDGGGIFVMGATGESVRRLTDLGYNPGWSPDGTELLCASEGVSDPAIRTSQSRLWRVDVANGARRLVAEGDAVQPSWSPHGLRIAYWGIPAGGARRVLWTVPARAGHPLSNGEATRLVDDSYLNWSPVWSPDGRHLYFASDRSGSMNLWRVAIDEATGKALGEPEPLSTPAQWSGLLSLSRDGRRILYATRSGKSNLEKVAFEPAAGQALGTPQALTQGSRHVHSCDASPDGQWIAVHSTVPHENLFILRPDGSDLRQLTNDPYKNRQPRWSPDGSRIVFYSNRGGRYDLWTIRPDGSGLEQVTGVAGPPPTYPLWSPDGRRLACSVFLRGTMLVDLARPLAQRAPVELPVAPIAGRPRYAFEATSWSPDGRWLAGNFDRPAESPVAGIVLYSFATAGFSRLTERGTAATFLHDSRRLLFRDQGELQLLDIRTRQVRRVLSSPADQTLVSMCTSPDDRVLYLVRESEEGHVWMLTLG
ncbi:MAG TPA: protein kinase [Thermoanaerobaculia bacterium]|nr:protein kinase [Thermoanaerobaculia bacterium]